MPEPKTDNVIQFPKPTRHIELPPPSRVASPDIFSACLAIHMNNHTKDAIDAPFGRIAPRLPWWPIVFALAIGGGATAVILSLL